MGQIVTGIVIILFGVFIGNAGLASAGGGMRIPMIPLGIYIVLRGFRALNNENKGDFDFEKTPFGKIALGILLIIFAFGVGGSTELFLVLIGVAIYFLYNGVKRIKTDSEGNTVDYP